MANRKTVLVLGGTGHYGRCIVKSLLSKDVNVRVMTRNIEQAGETLGDKVEFVSGDILSNFSVKQAIFGVDCIIIAISAFVPKQIRRLKEIEQDAVISMLKTAKNEGINRIVYISVFEANREFAGKHNLAAANEKAEVELWLKSSDLNWTVLGAPPSMQIFFSMIRGNKMMVPGGGPAGLPTISPLDLGEIAAQASLREDLSGLRIKLVGPEALSFPDAAKRISKVWEKKIKFQKIPLIFPLIAYNLTSPLSLFSDNMLFIHNLLGYIKLLNNFPQSYVSELPELHRELLSLFQYKPATLEMEAERRK